MKKRVYDIKLVDRPLSGKSNSENSPHSGRLDKQSESLIKVKTKKLGEAPGDPTCLIAIQANLCQKSHLPETTLVDGEGRATISHVLVLINATYLVSMA